MAIGGVMVHGGSRCMLLYVCVSFLSIFVFLYKELKK